MSKIPGNDVTFAPEMAVDPEEPPRRGAVFNENAVLFDYLQSLLTPPPKISLDSGRVSFVYNHAEKDASFGPSEAADSLLSFEANWSKGQSLELRQENDQLRLKVSRLMAQLNETELNLDSALTENLNLKTTVGDLQTQLNIFNMMSKSHHAIDKIKAKAAAVQVYQDSALIVDQMLPKHRDPEPEPPAAPAMAETVPVAEEIVAPMVALEPEPAETEGEQFLTVSATESEFVAPQPVAQWLLEPAEQSAGEPEPEPAYRQSAADYPVRQSVPDQAPAAAETGSVAGAGARPEKVMLAPPTPVKSPQKSVQTAAPAQRKLALPERPAAKSVSKVIKRPDLKQRPAAPQAEQSPKPPFQPALREPEALPRPLPTPAPQAAAEPPPEFETGPEMELLQAGVDDTGIEPAPVPKALVKRQMLHYKQSQDQADAPEAPPVGSTHDIIR